MLPRPRPVHELAGTKKYVVFFVPSAGKAHTDQQGVVGGGTLPYVEYRMMAAPSLMSKKLIATADTYNRHTKLVEMTLDT